MFARIVLRSSAGILFLCCLAITSAYGQSSYVYTDSWADTEMAIPENGHEDGRVSIVGSGVLEFGGGHMGEMTLTLTSPSGASTIASGRWLRGGGAKSLTVSINAISGSSADLGNFVTQSQVEMICPFEPETHSQDSLTIEEQSSNTIYYSYIREGPSLYSSSHKMCVYRACIDTDQNPPNGCWGSVYVEFEDNIGLQEACSQGIRITYKSYRIPYIYSWCIRDGHYHINNYNPCPYGNL